MQIPLYTILIVYLLGLIIFMVWAFFNVWHLTKFGFFDFTGKINVFVFIGFTAVILFLTGLMLQGTPWLDSFNLFQLPSGLFSPSFGSEV